MFRTALFAAALAASACAAPSASTPAAGVERDCFRNIDVSGYEIVDERRMLLRINAQRQYILTLQTSTRDFDYTNEIAVRSYSSFVCVGEPTGVELISGRPPVPHRVTAVERAPPRAPAEGS